MQEKVKALLNKLLEWWKSLSIKQRTIIISVSAVIILAFVILVTFLSRPQYSLLATCESTKESSEIKDLLDKENITYEISPDGLQVKVLSSQLADANLLLGANDIQASAYSIDNVTNGSFSTTESDKKKKYILYLESHLENDFIQKFDAIKSADVQLNVPDDDGTLIADDQASYAAIVLELDGDFTTDNAEYLAKAVATALGNDDTKNITIMDTDGNMLFSGADDSSVAGGASSQLSVKQQAQQQVSEEVKKVLQGTNGFDNIEVASNIAMDFSTKKETNHTYTPADGQKQGVLAESDVISSTSTTSSGGTPGTTSNSTDTTYVTSDGGTQSSTSDETHNKYVPNENITETETPAGTVDLTNSSIAVTAIKYKIVKQSDAQDQGLLDGTTWEAYKAANGDKTKMDADADLVTTVAKATGVAESNISIVAYSQNWFVDNPGLSLSTTDIIVIVLIVLILGLLAFVILRSMVREKKPKTEKQEELSVETLLQSNPQPEEELENIEVETKSETRKMIEKFVDDNPEAAANLLRNWLNEDWG